MAWKAQDRPVLVGSNSCRSRRPAGTDLVQLFAPLSTQGPESACRSEESSNWRRSSSIPVGVPDSYWWALSLVRRLFGRCSMLDNQDRTHFATVCGQIDSAEG